MSMTEPSDRCTFLIEHLDLPEATGDPGAVWEVHQLEFLNNPSLLAIDSKSRQIAWSWTAAAEAVAEGALTPRSTAIFVSINQDEAKEKVRYAKQVIEALDRDVRPPLLHDAETFLEFRNGSRLLSHPCRPVRGKARATVYLDELAHYPKDREIYQSVLPVLTRGGRLRAGSSPLGAQGMFWEIHSQKLRPFPGYRRRTIPWWVIATLCKDVAGAEQLAAPMTTEERVLHFGTPRLVDLFENMLVEDFQQEYECAWLDESTAWITWDEIKRNQVDAQAGQLWYRQAKSVDEALAVIDELAYAMATHQAEPALAGGMDVGRRHHLSEIIFVGRTMTGQLPYRLGISLSAVEFDDQKAVVVKAMQRLPVTQLLIDQNGLGMQLAEQLHTQFSDRVQGVDFTNASKELWATELKIRLQRAQVPLPLDRQLAYQLHSIKKTRTAAKNAVFDTARNEEHHADKFWALALAVWAARTENMPTSFVMKAR